MHSCFHCGLPACDDITATIQGRQHFFCCYGCSAVAQSIDAGGLGDFYQFRDRLSNKPETPNNNFAVFDQPDVQEEFVTEINSQKNQAMLLVRGISCAACAWLIEKRLAAFPAISEVRVNATNYRARIVWDSHSLKLSEIFKALSEIGYQPEPYTASSQQQNRHQENRLFLIRLGVAGIGMMQVGMYAIVLHAGALQGIAPFWQDFFRFISLIVATPVVLFSARPFFVNVTKAIKRRYLNMDVPVALAIGLAYIASIYGTVSGTGDVYYDSVSMFTFFLLLGRYLEMRVRHSSAFSAEHMGQLLPRVVEVQRNGETVSLPLKALKKDDCLCVPAGGVIPCDGVIEDGTSYVDESIISGESRPLKKNRQDTVIAGATNVESALQIRATAVGKDTQLAQVQALVENAALEKPRVVSLADTVASYFVSFILVAAVVVMTAWWFVDSQKALWVTLSVLVATCPCALSLATPTAYAAGTVALQKLGVLVRSPHFIETIPSITHVVFDKTGTLSFGDMRIAEIKILGDDNENQVTEKIAALERFSQHPIAKAFSYYNTNVIANDVNVEEGRGIRGLIDGREYRFGKASYACDSSKVEYPDERQWQLLSRDKQALAWLRLDDQPRDNVAEVISVLRSRNKKVMLLSGDRTSSVASFAEPFALDAVGDQLPQDKLAIIQKIQRDGGAVLMVGDGINDVPVLKGADVSLAMGNATALAQTHADAVLVNNDLLNIVRMWQTVERARHVMRQNLTWAALYNLSMLPLAALGFVPPYLAAIGMSASSLIVVLNALRLRRK